MKYQIITLNKKNIVDFAKERNNLLKKVNVDWIFFVDSDEKIPPQLKNELKNLNPLKYETFIAKRKNYFLGQFIGQDKIIRLVKKGSGKWVRAVHETFKPSHPAGVIKYHLIHNTADNLENYINKINNYSNLHAIANKKEGKGSNIFKIIFFPIFKFIQTYFKSRHVVFSIMASLHSFLSWSKQYIEEK